MQINIQDIRVDTFNTGSGWFPNYSGVKVLHLPTGISASCQEFRGQHANRAKAFSDLIKMLENETDYAKQMELF